MTEGDETIGREEAERRELEAAGWQANGRGAKTIWRSPSDGRWYAHYQAIQLQRKGERTGEENLLLGEHGFERTATEGGRERWSRCEQGSLQSYVRAQAVKQARKEGS